ncbi:MAG: 7-carboxy-7-deazaguanine synthase, partial [Planctomycetota bacterium]|nr:7-carboxy-7-deazaguanine synthase [Planctomycetota bacterium]
TNGMFELPIGVDWISCSPKRGVPARALIVGTVDEVRIVVDSGELPDAKVTARHHFVSPAFDVTTDLIAHGLLESTIELCKANPRWRLSLPDHKTWGVR